MEKGENNFTVEQTQDDSKKAKEDRARRDLLHNILRGPLSGEKKRVGTFSDTWLC